MGLINFLPLPMFLFRKREEKSWAEEHISDVYKKWRKQVDKIVKDLLKKGYNPEYLVGLIIYDPSDGAEYKIMPCWVEVTKEASSLIIDSDHLCVREMSDHVREVIDSEEDYEEYSGLHGEDVFVLKGEEFTLREEKVVFRPPSHYKSLLPA